MFFVMVEISNFRQLSRLRENTASEIRGLLEHFSHNRGGKLAREQNGFFLFAFHPLREKVLEQVTDFLFLTAESLEKKKDELFGFSLLLDQDKAEEATVFNRLKTLVFLAPRENRIWAGPGVLATLIQFLPVSDEDPLAEILGPPVRAALSPLRIEELLEMTSWVEALKHPLSRQLTEGTGRTGKVLRLKGTHITEKYFVLKAVLDQIYGARQDFPVLFPVQDSRDFLSQLLAWVDPEFWRGAAAPADQAWGTLLEGRGGAAYPGDAARDDVVQALGYYFRHRMACLVDQGLPPVFVFLSPQGYQAQARNVLEAVLGELVAQEGLRLLLLEDQEAATDFMGTRPSLSWTFPTLSIERILKEREARGWEQRFPVVDPGVLATCEGRGLAWVHHLWSLQEGHPTEGADPSWTLFQALDASHQKVYFVYWAGRGLLDEGQLVPFFQQWGEDPAVIADKVLSLKALGFFLRGVTRPLREDFGPRLVQKLGNEGRELLGALGQFLFGLWKADHRLSEVLFGFLRDHGLHPQAIEVLSYYLTNKINQGQGDFLTLLRRDLWESAPSEELKETFLLMAAAAKLRFSLNLKSTQAPPKIERFRRSFGPRTESRVQGEWELQLGRYHLRTGDLNAGFSLLKKALLEAQQGDDRSLEVRSEVEIGLALLRKHRFEEGREYFDIALRSAEKTQSPYLIALTCGLDAVALFLLGHLSGALKSIDRGLAAAGRGGLRQARVYIFFLKGRVHFDLGDYTGALTAFEAALAVARRYRVDDAVPVLLAWGARAEAYAGDAPGARSVLEAQAPGAERSYFLAEAWYFERDWERALGQVREARTLLVPTRPFGQGERIDWASGYSAIEDRALGQAGDPGVLSLQTEAFEAFLAGQCEGLDSGPVFTRLLSQKFLLDLDPASAQIYYWYYWKVSQSDPHQEAFRHTLLGRSLKDVQMRSSRIEDPALRQDYLAKPYWNALFSAEARKLKLL